MSQWDVHVQCMFDDDTATLSVKGSVDNQDIFLQFVHKLWEEKFKGSWSWNAKE